MLLFILGQDICVRVIYWTSFFSSSIEWPYRTRGGNHWGEWKQEQTRSKLNELHPLQPRWSVGWEPVWDRVQPWRLHAKLNVKMNRWDQADVLRTVHGSEGVGLTCVLGKLYLQMYMKSGVHGCCSCWHATRLRRNWICFEEHLTFSCQIRPFMQKNEWMGPWLNMFESHSLNMACMGQLISFACRKWCREDDTNLSLWDWCGKKGCLWVKLKNECRERERERVSELHVSQGDTHRKVKLQDLISSALLSEDNLQVFTFEERGYV